MTRGICVGAAVLATRVARLKGTRRRNRMRELVTIALLTANLCMPLSLFAQAQSGRVLDAIEERTAPGVAELVIKFNLPLLYVSHTPADKGDRIAISLRPLRPGDDLENLVGRYQTLRGPPNVSVPLRGVVFEGGTGSAQSLIVRFNEPVSYVVRAGKDARSVVVSVSRTEDATLVPVEPTGDAPPPPPPRDVLSEAKVEALMAEAKTAMTKRDYARAITLYTKAAQDVASPQHPQALELLGLARERNGQLAHAKAEYESYLTRYPEGDDAERVRQRLAGLLTAIEEPREKLRDAKRGRDKEIVEPEWDVYGSISQFYERGALITSRNGHQSTFAVLSSDVSVTARRQTEQHDMGARFVGGQQLDLLNSGDDTRLDVSEAYAEVDHHRTGLSARVGRQLRSSGGILGRFDGALVGYQVLPQVKANVVVGTPVNRARDGLKSDRILYGISADLGTFKERYDFNIFAIEQRAEGVVDRRAIGAEMRYSDETRTFFGLVDYDIFHRELNALLASGTLTFEDRSNVNVTLDVRQSPFLTTSNAVIGQPVGELADLRDIFTDAQLRQLAKDRTISTRSLAVTGSKPLSDRLQVSATTNVVDLGGSPTSGGVIGFSGTGYDWFHSLQLIGTDLLGRGSTGIVDLRYSDVNLARSYGVNLSARLPITNTLRINPRLDLIRRENKRDSGERLTVRPSVRVDYRVNDSWSVELDVGADWVNDRRTGLGSDITRGYFFNLGYRWLF